MTINTILDIILNQRLGLDEYNINYLYPEIHKNLLTYTLPIFSQYFPCYRRYAFTPKDHPVPNTDNQFYLEIDEITENDLKIISIAKAIPTSSVESNAAYDGYNTTSFRIEDLILNMASTNVASQMRFSFRKCHFIAPNMILLKGYGVQILTLELKIAFPSFTSIPDSVIEQFLDLATADISIYIYNKLKHYDNIPLPVGNIELKLDQLSNGVSMREEIINRFKSKGYPNTAINHYYTYE